MLDEHRPGVLRDHKPLVWRNCVGRHRRHERPCAGEVRTRLRRWVNGGEADDNETSEPDTFHMNPRTRNPEPGTRNPRSLLSRLLTLEPVVLVWVPALPVPPVLQPVRASVARAVAAD